MTTVAAWLRSLRVHGSSRKHYHELWDQFVIRCPRRDELRRYRAENGVGTEVYSPLPLPPAVLRRLGIITPPIIPPASKWLKLADETLARPI